jgi:hypothetical protein
VPVFLFGYLEDDFLGRVIAAPIDQPVGRIAEQLVAWGWAPEPRSSCTITNEAGEILDPQVSIAEAGLGMCDIVRVTFDE